MAKAISELKSNLKFTDVVVEVVDARCPLASRNPVLLELAPHKPRIVVFTKSDLADPAKTQQWKKALALQKETVVQVNGKTGQGKLDLVKACEKHAKKGPVNVMVIGIPNVGKSTLINILVGKKTAKAENRPGVTRQLRWIDALKNIKLLDSPGLLWPKIASEEQGAMLAATGTISSDLIDPQELALWVMTHLVQHYPKALLARYPFLNLDHSPAELLQQLGQKRGLLIPGGEVNLEKTATQFLTDVRSGKCGGISYEVPD